MQVRATEIVVAAYQRGEQPPDPFPIVELDTEFKKPDLLELKAVRNLQHLVRCLEYMFLNPEQSLGNLGASIPERDDAHGWERWKNNFYRAAYKNMLVGAVLYGAYNEPFYLAEKEGRAEFLDHCTCPSYKNWLSSITESDIDYLRRFAVYNFGTEDESATGQWIWKDYERVFGPLADWLVADGKTKGVEDNLGYWEPEEDDVNPETDAAPEYDSAELGVLREIMLLVAGYEHFPNKLASKSKLERRESTLEGRRIGNPSLKVSVVLFGRFCIEEISMPKFVGDGGSYLLTKSLAPETESRSLDIASVLHALQWKSTRPDLHDGYPATCFPNAFQFLVYVLRKHVDLKFKPGLFEFWSDSDYQFQVKSGSIFDETDFTPFVHYTPPILSYMQ